MLKNSRNRLIIGLGIGLAGLIAIFMFLRADEAIAPKKETSVSISAIYEDKIVYTTSLDADITALKSDCLGREGDFNECGTACAGEDDECPAPAAVCAFVCELVEPLKRNPNMPDMPEPFKAETARLKPVGSFSGDGIATREWDGAAFIHTVTVKAEDPGEGRFYQGWLMGGNTDYLPTGRLERSGGGFAMTFSGPDDLRGLDRVVVTTEPESRAKEAEPGVEVLSGSFMPSK